MAQKERQIVDVWLIALIGLLVLTIGGGLYVTGRTILSRLDAISIQTRSGVARLETEVFELRKQLQSVEHRIGPRPMTASDSAAGSQSGHQPAQ